MKLLFRFALVAIFLAPHLVRSGEPLTTKSEFNSRITVSVIRGKSTRIEGGDFDDKRDRITFTIKLRNSDPNRSFPGLRVEFFLFGQNLLNPKALELLQKFETAVSLDPLQEFQTITPEVENQWDDTGAIFGSKYKGWYLLVFGPNGELLFEKRTTSFLDNLEGLSNVQVGGLYNRKLEPVPGD